MTHAYRFPHHHLLGIEGLSATDITAILDRAEAHYQIGRQSEKKQSLLVGRTVINLFFEDSTRTRTSFELAAKRMGADVINMQVASSSLKKGETLLDTAMTLNAMNPDFIAVRHGESGAVELLSRKVKCAVINGGDGSHEHPTQALLDALAIRIKRGHIAGQTIAICGDILHSRVARSNILLLTTMGAKVRVIAPPTLLPPAHHIKDVEMFHDMRAGLKDCDIIMMLRIQKERMQTSFIPSLGEFFRFYGLNAEKLSYAKDDALVMHPGPINRGVEIDGDIADDINRSIILDQVEMGVAVRQAVFELLLPNLQHMPTMDGKDKIVTRL